MQAGAFNVLQCPLSMQTIYDDHTDTSNQIARACFPSFQTIYYVLTHMIHAATLLLLV